MNERLKQQLDFILEIDKEKNILRQTHLSGHGRNENDAEHAWHMAIMAYMLKDYANEPVDIAKVMIMCLIHDIVEIDAGDTYAYDTEGLKTQKAREDAAKERIFSLLPEDQKKELTALFDEFENYQTPESKFAHSLDNLQPLLLNNSNGGGDWREHQVTSEQVYGRQRKTQLGSETLYKVTDQILKENIEKKGIYTICFSYEINSNFESELKIYSLFDQTAKYILTTPIYVHNHFTSFPHQWWGDEHIEMGFYNLQLYTSVLPEIIIIKKMKDMEVDENTPMVILKGRNYAYVDKKNNLCFGSIKCSTFNDL